MLRVLLVDDEMLARLRLRDLLASIDDPPCEVLGEAGDAAAAIAWLDRDPAPDLLLLDIALPGASGLALARRLLDQGSAAPAVVFVTAHAEHALAAFELEAADYLTKPVSRDRLQAALRRVAQRRAWLGTRPGTAPGTTPPGASQDTGPAGTAQGAELQALVVSDRGRLLRLPLAQVLYLKAEQKYLTLRSAERSYVLDGTLTDLEQRLGAGFVRVHRNALVAVSALRELARRGAADTSTNTSANTNTSTAASDADPEIGGWAVRVAPNDEWLAVSRRQLAAVRQALSAGGRAI